MNVTSPSSLVSVTVPSLWGCFHAQVPVCSSHSLTLPSSSSIAFTKVTYPLSTSGFSSSKLNTLSAPAKAIIILLSCWLTWLIGWEKLLLSCKNDARAPKVNEVTPDIAKIEPSIAQAT